jgi:hypothetical protein
MALLVMTLLTSLMLALASISQTEPLIAVNHLHGTQARVLAESGVELALWALSNPEHPAGLPAPLPDTPAPFDGVTFVRLGDEGGFTLRVASDAGGDAQRRRITSVGWMPTNSPSDRRPKAHRAVALDVVAVPRLAARAPCALCVKGALSVSGNVTIDARTSDAACGEDTRYGTLSGGETTLTAPAASLGGAGAGAQYQPPGTFEPVTLSTAALDALKTLAWRSGTYFGPGFPRGGIVSDGGATWPGRVVFDATLPLRDGIVFVDTTDGRNLGDDPADLATLAEARLEAGAFAGRSGFRGWIVVNGSLEIAAGLELRGLVYAVDALTYRGPGSGLIEGLAVSLNARSVPTLIEPAGELAMRFDCQKADGAGLVPHEFLPIPGTYRETDD